MDIKLLEEPLLQFGKGEYICPRTGIYKYNVSDINDIRPDKIVIGFIGLSESINIAISWIKKCRNHIESKKSKQPNLFTNFPDNKLDITGFEVYANKCILSLLKNRLKDFYIGKSFTPYGACPPQTFAFKAEKGVYLHNQKYVTIIGKDLNFILTTNKQIDFWHKNAKIDDQGILVSVRNQIYSFIFPLSADILPDDIDAIFHLIQTEGHFVFYHPDSL